MNRLILQIIAGILGFFLATIFVSGVKIEVIPEISGLFGIQFTAAWQVFLLIGCVLGLFNYFIKPILDKITLPLKILTFGLFSLVINMAMVWIVDIIFPELIIPGIVALFWTTIIIWGLSIILGFYKPKKKIKVIEEEKV